MRLLIFFVFLTPSLVWGAEEKNPLNKKAPDRLEEFFDFNQKLSQAVCDEATVSKAPFLHIKEKAGAHTGEVTAPLFELAVDASESELMSFLLDDPTQLVAAPEIQKVWKDLKQKSAEIMPDLKMFKKRYSLEICTAFVTSNQMPLLVKNKPGYFYQLREIKNSELSPSFRHQTTLLLRDLDQRFAKWNGTWKMVGWAEPFEVERAFSGKREYLRLAHPVTNQTRFVLVMGENAVPLGYLYPVSSKKEVSWAEVREESQKPFNKQKQAEIYLLLMERQAFHALQIFAHQSEEIRKLQEFYKSLMSAYQIFPNDERFAVYVQKNKDLGNDAVARKILDDTFFRALHQARMNQASVTLGYLQPDPGLHGIYLEYENRLKRLTIGSR